MSPGEMFRLLPRLARIRALRLAGAAKLRVWVAEAEVLRTIAVAQQDAKAIATGEAWTADLKAAQLSGVRA